MSQRGRRREGSPYETMGFSCLRKEGLAKCPSVKQLCSVPGVCIYNLSTEQRQERVTCQNTDLETEEETGEMKNKGEGVSGRTSNRVYKHGMKVYHQNVFEKQCTIVYSFQQCQKCVGMLKHVWVGVPVRDCNWVWGTLMWPSARGLTLLSKMPSQAPTVCPVFPYNSILPTKR